MKSSAQLKKSRLNIIIKNIITFSLLAIGVLVLCGFLAVIQNVSAERTQKRSSERILDEVSITLRDNDETVNAIFDEYNKINQTTLSTLGKYVEYIDVMGPLSNAASMTEQELSDAIVETTGELKNICNNISVEGILIVKENGEVVLGSDVSFMNQNISSLNENDSLLKYAVNQEGEETKNGTFYVEDGETHYSPVFMDYQGTGVYIYSTYFGEQNGEKYFLLTYARSAIIDAELSGLKNIGSVLDSFTVGKNGFLFSVDTQTGTFNYFDDGHNVLTGEQYSEYGMTSAAAKGQYAGYQTIKGTTYYCVAKDFKSSTYGEFTVIAAVVSQEEILMKNVLTIIFSMIAFIMVAAITSSYGLILRRDIANHILSVEEKHRGELKEETADGLHKFTDEEIDERTKIYIETQIESGKDKKLKRRNIGVRNAKGKQNYFSSYVFGRMSAVIVVGLIAIFFISFFSQTLLGLNDATSVSTRSLNDIVLTLESNTENTSTIQNYVDNEFLSKARLISYMLEETPEVISLNAGEDNIHRVIEKDENGKNIPLFHEDYPTAPRYAVSNSPTLKEFADNNGIKAIYVYADDGKVMATSTDLWYFEISKNKEDQSYPFNDILDDKVDYYIQEEREGEITGEMDKYIGTEFFYYTYLDTTNNVVLASKTDYESFKAGTWTEGDIMKHRSMIQIGVDQSSIRGLYGTTEMSYVLSNMHVYGDKSFFITFDASEDHICTYSPYEAMIGKKAASLGISESVFMMNGTYNGFQKLNGEEYYQTVVLMGDYYIATAIPTASIYEARNSISWYTLLFSGVFIILSSTFFTVSSDKADKDYCNTIRYKEAGHEEGKDAFVLAAPSGKKRKTTSAISRFSRTVWSKKTPEEKLSVLLMGYMTIASILILVSLIVALTNPNQDSIFKYIFSGVWEKGFNIFAITESLMIMIILITVTRLAQAAVRSFCGTLGARIETTGNLIVSVLRYGGVIGGLFYCLYLFGFNTGSLLASAGILSIVIGLGAQSLISDIIAGIFIVFEGEFQVGDIVTIGGFRGTVLEIGLRTTKIEDTARNIKIFNNSSISGVVNMTKEASFAAIDVSIEYGESIERVEKVLKDEFPKIKKRLPEIMDGPFYKGVSELGESGVVLKIVAQCTEKNRLQLARDLNREIFILFGKNNINIPFPQVTMSYLEEDSKKATLSEKKASKEFLDEQKELGVNAEVSENNIGK